MKLNIFFKISSIITLLFVFILPSSVKAAVGTGTLIDISNTLANGVATSLGYLMFTLATVAFFWGIVQFIWAARQGNGGKDIENGKQFMVWGLVSLFVMFSVWGIIPFTQNLFNIKGETTIVIPNIQLLGAPSGSSKNTSTSCPEGNPCTTTDALGNKVNGFCNNSNQCVPSRSNTNYTQPSTCIYGNSCTTIDASNNSVSGFCNSSNQCVPSRSNTYVSPVDPNACPDKSQVRNNIGDCVKIGSNCIVVTTNGTNPNPTFVSGTYDKNGSCNANNNPMP